MSPRRAKKPTQDIPEHGPLFGTTVHTDSRGAKWDVRVEYLDIDGRLAPCGFWVRSFEVLEDHGQMEARSLDDQWREVTTAAVKMMPVASLARECRRTIDRVDVDDLDYFNDHLERREAGQEVEPLDQARLDAILRRISRYNKLERQTGGRPRYEHEHWQAVAAVYRRAYAEGEPPSAAVADRFKVSRDTARQWVRRARGLGLLPSTDERRSRA